MLPSSPVRQDGLPKGCLAQCDAFPLVSLSGVWMRYRPLGTRHPPDWDSGGAAGPQGELASCSPGSTNCGLSTSHLLDTVRPGLRGGHFVHHLGSISLISQCRQCPGTRPPQGTATFTGVSGLCPALLRQVFSAMLRGGVLVGAVSLTGHPELLSSCPVRRPLTCVRMCAGREGACVSLLRWEF